MGWESFIANARATLGLKLNQEQQLLLYCQTLESPALYDRLHVLPNYADDCLAYKALFLAIHTKKIDECLQRFPNLLDARNKRGFSMLHIAARNGNIKVFDYIFQNRPALFTDTKNIGNYTILMLAASRYHKVIVSTILRSQHPNLLAFVQQNNGWGDALNQTSQNRHCYKMITQYLQGQGITVQPRKPVIIRHKKKRALPIPKPKPSNSLQTSSSMRRVNLGHPSSENKGETIPLLSSYDPR